MKFFVVAVWISMTIYFLKVGMANEYVYLGASMIMTAQYVVAELEKEK